VLAAKIKNLNLLGFKFFLKLCNNFINDAHEFFIKTFCKA
jgi:hypothetical protein